MMYGVEIDIEEFTRRTNAGDPDPLGDGCLLAEPADAPAEEVAAEQEAEA